MNAIQDKIQSFFNISFKVKNHAAEFGATRELVFKFVGQEFNIVSDDIIERYYNELIMAKFLIAGTNGIKANSTLENQYQEFLKEVKQ